MKDIKDYLHLYLGCDVEDHNGNVFRMNLINIMDVYSGSASLKPILRPLSDMTTSEWNEMAKWNRARIFTCGDLWKLNAEETAWLLSKGFDLFELIPHGLAIDKTKS